METKSLPFLNVNSLKERKINGINNEPITCFRYRNPSSPHMNSILINQNNFDNRFYVLVLYYNDFGCPLGDIISDDQRMNSRFIHFYSLAIERGMTTDEFNRHVRTIKGFENFTFIGSLRNLYIDFVEFGERFNVINNDGIETIVSGQKYGTLAG
jgi:hypothetical protein